VVGRGFRDGRRSDTFVGMMLWWNRRSRIGYIGIPAVLIGIMTSSVNTYAVSLRTIPIFSTPVAAQMGESALRQVEFLGRLVSEKEQEIQQQQASIPNNRGPINVDGTGKSVYNTQKRMSLERPSLSDRPAPKQRQVWEALESLEQDMQLLDNLAGQRPQLSALEAVLLSAAVLSAAGGPLLLGGHITEFLAPFAAAFTAAIGIGAEYTGKVAVADGKEIAASTIQCAAEAEGYLANAERAKAITPLCVGIGATAATFALLVPVLLDSIGAATNLQLMTEIYLCCPLISVLAAAVASLALQETRSFSEKAIGIGNRRFARSGLVGRTWLSSTELIERKSTSAANRWRTFSLSVLPAPLIGALVPGALPTKTIIVAALAAAESAFFLAQCESVLSRATDAVALKARSAAVCDTYANQGARSAAILPFTSALASLCAAATAAMVELPFIETLLSTGTVASTAASMVTVAIFPALSALFAAAASVSKARCEVDAEAAMQAASTIALQYEDQEEDPVLKPFRAVRELIRLTLANSIKEPLRRLFRRYNFRRRFTVLRKWFRRDVLRRSNGTRGPTPSAA
jgi:hypothetical protein